MRTVRGFTLVEATVSIVVIGVMLVAAVAAVGASRRTSQGNYDRLRGRQLAQMLLSEIVPLAYKDPAATNTTPPGLDSGESHTSRTGLDDVDDYHNLSQSPPADRSGVALPNSAAWSWQVRVSWVTEADLGLTSTNETGLKRIEVTVKKNGRTVATSAAIRSEAR